MPDLTHSLLRHDIGHLRIIASMWGIELTEGETDEVRTQLVDALQDRKLAAEILELLPAEVLLALEALIAEKGRIPWATFTRHYGEVRDIGPGRRDRVRPHLQPISAAEALFYRALIDRAFFDTPEGPLEFAYIPDDLHDMLSERHFLKIINSKDNNEKKPAVDVAAILGHPAYPAERSHTITASDKILDDLCTLLAALRLGIKPPAMDIPAQVLLELSSAADLIVDSNPQPEIIRQFLEKARNPALSWLVEAWNNSDSFNELRQVPGLICEGDWKNSPYPTRKRLLDFMEPIPKGKWWSLHAFIHAIKEKHPDYQRPAGDYDSWFIRRASDGQYLRGFSNWENVDGALIHYFITGIMHWLGMVDLAAAVEKGPPTAFRIRVRDSHFSPPEKGKLHTSSNGLISVPRLLPRAVRYQIARFCEWEEPKGDEYRYRVTPASLVRARQQRLKPDQLLAILNKYTAAPLPPPFTRAILRWELNGTEARFEELVVLRVSRPEVLEQLRKSKAGRFLKEPLGPTAVIVKKGAKSKVLQALVEMGLLAECVE